MAYDEYRVDCGVVRRNDTRGAAHFRGWKWRSAKRRPARQVPDHLAPSIALLKEMRAWTHGSKEL